jgi:prolyl-tRNA synthetase
MPTIQSADLWRESGRYDAYGPEMLRLKDRHDREMLYSPTAEELFTRIFADGARSCATARASSTRSSGSSAMSPPPLRRDAGREFLMKDGYSFDLDEAAAATATSA